MEVILGTSVGFIYVVEHNGVVKMGFPIQMAEIQGQVAVADVNNDGHLELIAMDLRHNLAVFDAHGKELWEKHLSGYSPQGAMVGDVDGDGQVDIVAATENGHIWALNGKTGETLKHYPVRTGGRILSPVALIRLNPTRRGLHVVVPSHDGKVYIVEGPSGCAFKIDISEQSYTMVLADDVTGNGKLDLIVTTMNGHVLVFGTNVPFEPTMALRARDQGRNNFVAVGAPPRLAAFASTNTRTMHDVIGATWPLAFDVVDDRPKSLRSPFTVKITLGGRGKLLEKKYTEGGSFVEMVPAPRTRSAGTVVIEVVDQHGISTFDFFSVSFNLHFYKTLKWVLVLPFLTMVVILLFGRDITNTLPL